MLTSLEQVSRWLTSNGVGPGSPEVLSQAHLAADRWVSQRVEVHAPPGEPETPDDLVLAVCLLTARYLARRSSPDGFVGMGEFGPARVARIDQDVESLIGPYRPVVFG